ncbi:MAG: TonB-dependent receptor [Cyclobacteriaceae bacterium]
MAKTIKYCIFSCLWIGIFFTVRAQTTLLSGQVVDEEQEAIHSAIVRLPALGKFQFTDEEGKFSFEITTSDTLELLVSTLGYQGTRVLVPAGQKWISVVLESKLLQLAEVEIQGSKMETSPGLSSRTMETLERTQLNRQQGAAFANLLENVAGVTSINTGVGIAKPVIRGMSFNRVMVLDQGIRQEGQQWGADHGLEIDQFDVERVEIIKGPASLQYGSDAMGGVIHILPSEAPEEGVHTAELQGIYKYNNALRGASVSAQGNRQGLIYRLRFSRQDFDNYRVPADEFNYAGFILPIYGQRLRNTSGQERNFAISLGVQKKWGSTRLKFSRFQQRVGLFPGAVGIPSAFQLQRYDEQRSVALPRQNNTHWKLLWNTQVYIGNSELDIDVGFQRNIRREESLPHTMGVGENRFGTLALGLFLNTYSLNLKLTQPLNKGWQQVIGLQAQRMENDYSGFEFLLPQYRSWMAGAYSFWEYRGFDDWQINAGLRLDGGAHDIREHQQPLYDENLEPNGEFSIRNPDIDRQFFNPSASLGAVYQASELMKLKLNLGSSFRMPTPNELASNGIHHGTFRHEKGNADIESERGYQLDLALNYCLPRLSLSLTPFASYYDRYIYLSPTPFYSTLPSGSQITWEYRQASSRFWGGEIKVEAQAGKHMTFRASAEYVNARNLDSGLPLPLTPPLSAFAEWSYLLPFRNQVLKQTEIWVELRYVADQRQVDRNERPTEGYTLPGLGFSQTLNILGYQPKWMVRADNLLNTTYFNHLSRYRLLNLPEAGFNLTVSLHLPFSFQEK